MWPYPFHHLVCMRSIKEEGEKNNIYFIIFLQMMSLKHSLRQCSLSLDWQYTPDTEQPKFQNAKYVHLLYALKHM